jgi:CIC family chloride channel protein
MTFKQDPQAEPAAVGSTSPAGQGFFSRALSQLQSNEEVILVLTSVVIGIGAGVGAVIFRYLISGVEWIGYDWFRGVTQAWGKAFAVIVPTIGGLIVGILVQGFAKEAKGHGVPEVMEAVALKGGRIRPIVAIIKSLASSINIGTGGSVGREGPIVQIGSALGSTLGQALNLSDERIRNLVACGAAGGIAATFNSPIAGVFFALEIILSEFSVAYFGTVVISSVMASVIGQAVFGNVPAFPLPTQYHLQSSWEFLLYPFLGLLAALVGVVFVRLLYWSEDRFDSWKGIPEWVKPGIGGALIGVLALGYPVVTSLRWERLPHIFNVGYDVIQTTFADEILLESVLLLLGLKLIATCLTLGSGGSGGVFAPSLFMGAMLGAAFGATVNILFPTITAPPGAYALVGMAAVFSASAHAPITAMIILFELTGDYRIILPLMLTVVVATLVSRGLLHGESIYTLKLTRRGIRLQRGRDVDVMQGVDVGEVMVKEVHTVTVDMTLVELSEEFSRVRHHGFPVLDDRGRLWGMVTVSDLERAVAQNMPRRTQVSEIGSGRENLEVAYPNENIGVVLRRMGPRGLGRLPVVDPDDPYRLIGLVGRDDIIRAYNVAITRRAELSHRVRRMEAREPAGTQFVEISLTAKDAAIGSTVAALSRSLPKECVFVSIHRDSRLLIPHGDTRLRAGDRITAFIRDEVSEEVLSCIKGPRGAHG